MGALSVFGLLLPLITIAMLVVAIRALIRGVTLPRGGVTQASCENCQYPVAGLSSFACPECGKDLRSSGIITPSMEARRRGSMLGALAGWTYIVLFVGLFVVGIVGTLSVRRAVMTVAATTTTQTWPVTLNSSPGSLTLEQEYLTAPDGSQIDPVTLSPVDADFPSLELDTTGGTWTMTGADGNGAQLTALTEASVLEFLGETGADVSDETVQAEAADVFRAVEMVAVGGLQSIDSMTYEEITVGGANIVTGTTTTTTSTMPNFPIEAIIALATLGFLFIVWVVGLLVIVRRRARLLATAVPSLDEGSALTAQPA